MTRRRAMLRTGWVCVLLALLVLACGKYGRTVRVVDREPERAAAAAPQDEADDSDEDAERKSRP